MCIQGKVHIFTNQNVAVCSFAFGTKTSPNLLQLGLGIELCYFYGIGRIASILSNIEKCLTIGYQISV